ncbi:FMN-linked oxidoreductase [Laetiporus sulphureus 93-53]|uniref:FMN-linked oxidoreductase n=1 Tax=Laetiporus sulphureus 93-53 TaxID=1314785 RepID=A0A165EGZ6_9APHY|nr:FMN-linked oxidoreductase [Laetiporus sulphureus 93-53]KZT07032.1 FMN-linked oxidoreductase [Laetiporus sulphureus 93-53]
MASELIVNAPAPNVPYFMPAQNPPAGTALDPQPNGKPIPKLFQPLKIRGVEFHNRIWLSPLCQYSAENGKPSPWQFAHLGGILTRGPGLTVVEATAVVPEGRITPQDVGIWSDEHIQPWKEIVQFAHSQNQKIAVQLAHGGRKASTVAPWLHSGLAAPEIDGGWPDNVWGPSDIPYNEHFPKPKELSHDGVKRVVHAFANGARRALKAGFDVIEIHAAHGYLISEFLNPQANRRTDEYGGSFENRIRLLIEIVDALRAIIPPEMPLFVRVSGTDWLEEVYPNEHWGIEDTVRLAPILAEHGVDLLDVSSGGVHAAQRLKLKPLMQVPFSEAVRRAHGDKILVSAVGSITNGNDARNVIDQGAADVVFVGRQFQKNPGAVWAFAEDLGVTITVPHQIEWGFVGRGGVGRKGVAGLKQQF